MFAPQPKPKPRLLDTRAKRLALRDTLHQVRSEVKTRAGGRCEVCGKPGTDLHHARARSLGGRHTAENGVWLCRRCHEDVTGHVLTLRGRDEHGRLRWERIA